MSNQAERTASGPEPAADFDSLLAPISIDQPAGEALRYEGTYDRVEQLRRADDPTLPQGVWKTDLKKANWPEVARLCAETLETRSKDLRIAAWLCEAWTHRHGFAAVEPGLKLVAGLCESFWDEIHPQIDEDGLTMRLAPLLWLDDHLPRAIKALPVTQPQGDAAPYGWVDWERALYVAKMVQSDPSVVEKEGFKEGVTKEKFEVSVTLTPTVFYRRLAVTLEGAEEARGELDRTLVALADEEAPGFRGIRDVLAAIHGFVGKILAERVDAGEDLELLAELGELDVEAIPGGRIKSRADAFRRLNAAADYLLRTEPHSPVPYLVKRAVAWGGMPLSELFRELLKGGADLRTIYTLLGIKEETES